MPDRRPRVPGSLRRGVAAQPRAVPGAASWARSRTPSAQSRARSYERRLKRRSPLPCSDLHACFHSCQRSRASAASGSSPATTLHSASTHCSSPAGALHPTLGGQQGGTLFLYPAARRICHRSGAKIPHRASIRPTSAMPAAAAANAGARAVRPTPGDATSCASRDRVRSAGRAWLLPPARAARQPPASSCRLRQPTRASSATQRR
jgi:hypothetical protein